MAGSLDIGSLVAHLALDNKKWKASIAAVKTDQNSLSSRIAKNSGEMTSMGKRFMKVGGVVTAAWGLMASSAIKFNEQMANVATLIPGQTKRVGELKNNVRKLSVTYGKSTSDIAGGLYQVVSAFGDASDTSKKLEINVMAAAAGMSTTKDAIDLTSAVTKGYGDTTAKAVKKAADLAFLTVKLGQTTFPELAKSIGRVIPVAAKMNVSQEELYAGFATLTGVTGNAAEVSTKLNAILIAMIKPTEGMAMAIKQLGYDSADTMVKELGMVESLKKLIGTTDGSTEAAAKLFGRAEALTAVFALVGSQSDTYNEKLKAMGNSAGTLEEAHKEVAEGVNEAGFEFNKMKQQVIVAAQKFGELLLPILTKIFGIVGKVVGAVADFVGLD